MPGLVVGRLQNGSSAHGGFRSRDQGEVLACDAEKDLPGNIVSIRINRDY